MYTFWIRLVIEKCRIVCFHEERIMIRRSFISRRKERTMKKRIQHYYLTVVLILGLFFVAFPTTSWSLTADHQATSAFPNIPEPYFSQIQSNYHVFYGHTSHGSQIVTGLQMLNAQNPNLYAPPVIYDNDWTDLGDSSWPTITRDFLASNPQINMVMWSWCGQLSWITPPEVDWYLTQMAQLELEFPGIIFVYMTGHLDGGGPSETLYANNNRIRSYCAAYNKVLFDFADIESYDPIGNYYPYGSDCCEWCETWCSNQACPPCEECAHSHCFNCFQKGKTFWWMMANIAGWQPASESHGAQSPTHLLQSLCPRVPPPDSGTQIVVRNVTELMNAVQSANATGNVTIVLEDGTYVLDQMLWISGNNVMFRSSSGNRDSVIIQGQGMFGGVSHIFNVPGSFFTVANMTIGWVANHAIQIHSDADNAIVHDVHMVDTGEQMLKVSYREGDGISSENGLVEWCLFEYSAGVGPQYYIGGIDAHQAHNWIIRDNIFRWIRSPEADLAEFAIHFWSGSTNTVVERNTIINCDRGIGFGLGDRGHHGGIIRNNGVYTTRDVGIGLETSNGTLVLNNTVFSENYPNSIEYRFPATQGVLIVNNLTNAQIAGRDGGSGSVENNVTDAQAPWFIDIANGNFHLSTPVSSVVDQGRTLAEVTNDVDCEARPKGPGYDVGADEL